MEIQAASIVYSTLASQPPSIEGAKAQISNPSVKQTNSQIEQSKFSTEQSESVTVSAEVDQETIEFQQAIQALKARDVEVRAHEQAHVAAGGAYVTSGPSYVYQRGPDGGRYAIGGEVGIDTSPVAGDPEATLQKALVVQRAALAPAEPSAQDRSVASAAAQMAAQARADILRQKSEENGSMPGSSNSKESEELSSQDSYQHQESDNSSLIIARNDFEARLRIQS